MDDHRYRDCQKREPRKKEMHIASISFDAAELHVLEIGRFFWQSFAIPETCSWLMALTKAEEFFQDRGDIGLRVLSAIQAKRLSRSSCFRFNNPTCPACSEYITEHERQFMDVLRATRHDRPGSARTHAMLLCEGNDTKMLMERMRDLAQGIGLKSTKGRSMVETAQMH
ncbi:MAG: hypothetical protein AAFQ66_17975 [Pseudomonadota bacterium]